MKIKDKRLEKSLRLLNKYLTETSKKEIEATMNRCKTSGGITLGEFLANCLTLKKD